MHQIIDLLFANPFFKKNILCIYVQVKKYLRKWLFWNIFVNFWNLYSYQNFEKLSLILNVALLAEEKRRPNLHPRLLSKIMQYYNCVYK
jgi:hypothetical protein